MTLFRKVFATAVLIACLSIASVGLIDQQSDETGKQFQVADPGGSGGYPKPTSSNQDIIETANSSKVETDLSTTYQSGFTTMKVDPGGSGG